MAILPLTALVIGITILLNEDRYEGRTIKEWLVATRNIEAADAAQATRVIRDLPKQRLFPILREWMTASDNSFQQRILELLSKQHLVTIRSSARERRRAAFEAVAILGPEAKPLLPELSATLTGSQPKNVFDAAFAIAIMGSDGRTILERSAPNESRQTSAGRQAAQDMLQMTAFAEALPNWSTQSVAQVVRLRVIFNSKCLGAAARNHARLRGRVMNGDSRPIPAVPDGCDMSKEATDRRVKEFMIAATNKVPASKAGVKRANPYE